MSCHTEISLQNGKYTIINKDGELSCLRYGHPWRDLTGDNLILALVSRIEELECDISDFNTQLNMWRGYDNDQ